MSMATGADGDVHGILETATIQIRADQQAGFESAMAQAAQILKKAKGFQSMTLFRILERPDEYQLLVCWNSVDDHMTGFQKSDLFKQWRALLSSYFVATPVVHHSVQVMALM